MTSQTATEDDCHVKPQITHLREWVYGGIDGVVTTFAVVAGVAGADLSLTVILIISIAGLLGDGFSMAAGCFSSTKTDEDNYKRLYQLEEDFLIKQPESATAYLRDTYLSKGFKQDSIAALVATITQDKKLWTDTIMIEKHGLTENHHNAWAAALHTFGAFLFCGIMPVLPFIINIEHAIMLSAIVSGLTFFSIGTLKSFWSSKPWWWHGGETFFIGSIAAVVAYGTGYGLKLLLM